MNSQDTLKTYALVTPSYYRDFKRCEMLIESVHRFVSPEIKHYLIIEHRDLAMFKPLQGARVELIVVQDLVQPWVFRIPGINRFWFTRRAWPVKNWILQQIVKLSMPAALSEDVLIYADSDMFFVRSFDPKTFERAGKIPLFHESGQRGLIPHNDLWQAESSKLLGLSIERDCDINYVNQLIYWHRPTVMEMLATIEARSGQPWQKAILPLRSFSEYTLHGVYAKRIAGLDKNYWPDEVIRTHNHWEPKPLNRAELQQFASLLQPHHHSVMISSKSNTDEELIRQTFFKR